MFLIALLDQDHGYYFISGPGRGAWMLWSMALQGIMKSVLNMRTECQDFGEMCNLVILASTPTFWRIHTNTAILQSQKAHNNTTASPTRTTVKKGFLFDCWSRF